MKEQRIYRCCKGCAFNSDKCIAMDPRIPNCFSACYTEADLAKRYSAMMTAYGTGNKNYPAEHKRCLDNLKRYRERNIGKY